jgi:hypothetical protein
MQLSDIRKEMENVKTMLLTKSNVVSVGVGYKKVNGKKTDRLSIICSVEQKKPLESISDKDVIPKIINNIYTDVVQTGQIKAFENTTKERPALGGDSIGHYAITAGTLGCTVKLNGELMILSNNHVMANSNEAKIEDAILQPGPYDGGTSADQIASLKNWVNITYLNEDLLPDTDCSLANGAAGFLNFVATLFGRKSRLKAFNSQLTYNKVDAAIAKPVDDEFVSREIRGIGDINSTKELELDMKVQKQGRTTGLTKGIVDQIDVTTQVSYGTNKIALFSDQVIITSDSGSFSQPGDSGSAVLSGNDLVGLLFAGSDTVTIINRIENVFEAFGCTL